MILEQATEAIKNHPYNFLYDATVQKAFKELEKPRTDTLAISVPAPVKNLELLPLPTEHTDGTIRFNWFEPDDGPEATKFIDTLVKALNDLPTVKDLTTEQVNEIKSELKPGTQIRLIRMMDDEAPAPNSILTVERIDDAGQIHVKESGLALIPGVDDFELAHQ